ncbi:MAG: DNA primase [Candidatus Eisenbacteria bacterium]|nr:DNA primase [Candidatus Eisenbacteria bacterium]
MRDFQAMGGRGAARGSDDWVERVRAASDIAEVVGQTVALKRVGRNLVGLCPFHKEKSPSFSVNVERQFYHCFGCKAGGDVFRFVQETEKVGFLEAVELLSRRAGIAVPETRGEPGERGARAKLHEALEEAAAAYEQWLGDPQRGAATRAYLEGRGLARDTWKAFRLGLAPEGWENLVQRLRGKVGDDVLVQAGLAARRDSGGLYDRFRHRLMVPLVAPGGVVVGFGARALAAEDNPKYLNSPETAVYHKGAFLYALDQARRQVEPDGEIVVVEGYFDAIAFHQAGLRNTVATSGTALTSEQARLLKRVAGRVALTYDGDAAGQGAMMRSLGVLMGEGLEVAVVDLPAGEDPDTLVRRGGLEAWREARRRAADPVEFIQRHVLRAGGAGDPRERALHAVVDVSVAVGDPIRRRLLLERAGEVFGLPASVLTRAASLRSAGQGSQRPVAAAVALERRGERFVERKLLQLLVHHPGGMDAARARLAPGDFEDPDCRAVAEWLWSGTPEFHGEDAAAALVRELGAETPLVEDWDGEIAVETRLLVERRLKQQMKQRKLELQRATDEEELVRLNQEIYEIARSLRDLSA